MVPRRASITKPQRRYILARLSSVVWLKSFSGNSASAKNRVDAKTPWIMPMVSGCMTGAKVEHGAGCPLGQGGTVGNMATPNAATPATMPRRVSAAPVAMVRDFDRGDPDPLG